MNVKNVKTTTVLVVDDSSTARALITAALSADPAVRVVGEARDGAEAIDKARRLQPDVITMDYQMPNTDGFAATRQIMLDTPTPIVIVSGSLDVRDVVVSMEAMRAGALAIVAKPSSPASPTFERDARQFVATVKAMSQVKIVRRFDGAARRPQTPSVPRAAVTRSEPIRLVAIAASTGGPAALQKVLSGAAGRLGTPVVVVQHIALGFAEGLCAWLRGSTGSPVKLAEHGERLVAGTVYLAPDDQHIGVTSALMVELATAPPIRGFRPSATFLFDSVAQKLGAAGLGVILTGMGDDGVDGLRRLKAAGGVVLAQDEETSAVFGMPKAAIDAGVVSEVVPLDELADRIVSPG